MIFNFINSYLKNLMRMDYIEQILTLVSIVIWGIFCCCLLYLNNENTIRNIEQNLILSGIVIWGFFFCFSLYIHNTNMENTINDMKVEHLINNLMIEKQIERNSNKSYENLLLNLTNEALKKDTLDDEIIALIEFINKNGFSKYEFKEFLDKTERSSYELILNLWDLTV